MGNAASGMMVPIFDYVLEENTKKLWLYEER